MKTTRRIILLAITALALSQLACGSFTNDSRTLDDAHRYIDQKVLPAQGGW